MSRTDKDVPYRVHVMRNGVERHDHRFGYCDFAATERSRDRLPVRGFNYRSTCGLETEYRNYFRSLKLVSRSKLISWFSSEHYDRDNARIRKETSDVVKLHRAGEDISDTDIWNRQHRHSAEWEAW